MIVNIGMRTDIVTHYTEWLLNRLDEGYVYVRNPLFPAKVSRYDLTPQVVDCLVFCSKNYEPLLPHLQGIAERFGVYCFYTITAYGKDVEPGVPDIERSIELLLELSSIVGSQRVAWRYDPVLVTRTYTVERHLETFEHLASRLAGHVDRCIFSFVELYRRLSLSMPGLAPVQPNDRKALAQGLGAIAAQYGIPLQTCAEHGDYTKYGIASSGCTTLDTLGRANGMEFRKLKHSGMRSGCQCFESRDVGAYDTCLSGCAYCYATASSTRAKANSLQHDPTSPLLIGTVQPEDTLKQAAQKSLAVTLRQESLFL